MKVSGFTFVRNGTKLGYPYIQSLKSLLPLVDELVVNVPFGEDDTLDRVKEIDDPKLIVFESDWDSSLREGGRILSLQTNRALEKCTGDWAIYLQADEVIHEDDYESIRADMTKYLGIHSVDGLSFKYLHFEAGYGQTNPFRYRKQVRIVRNNGQMISWGDACGFARKDGGKLRKAYTSNRIFHYGWARVPDKMLKKNIELERLYHDDKYLEEKYGGIEKMHYEELVLCVPFKDAHPGVMLKEVSDNPGLVLPGNLPPLFLRKAAWKRLLKKWGIIRK